MSCLYNLNFKELKGELEDERMLLAKWAFSKMNGYLMNKSFCNEVDLLIDKSLALLKFMIPVD